MINVIKGNIFTTKAQTIVNTINCLGVMGAGIAFEFRLRYPEMFQQYVLLCDQKQINIGNLWIYKSKDRQILNFPTKYDWRYKSKIEYLEKGLQKFITTYKEKNITSIAFPLLGASNGGIPEDVSLNIMQNYLSQCDIPIEIFMYDPDAYDDLFLKFRDIFNSLSEKEISKKASIGSKYIKLIHSSMENEHIKTLSQLLETKGIGETTIEKVFNFIIHYKEEQTLFNNIQ